MNQRLSVCRARLCQHRDFFSGKAAHAIVSVDESRAALLNFPEQKTYGSVALIVELTVAREIFVADDCIFYRSMK